MSAACSRDRCHAPDGLSRLWSISRRILSLLHMEDAHPTFAGTQAYVPKASAPDPICLRAVPVPQLSASAPLLRPRFASRDAADQIPASFSKGCGSSA